MSPARSERYSAPSTGPSYKSFTSVVDINSIRFLSEYTTEADYRTDFSMYPSVRDCS